MRRGRLALVLVMFAPLLGCSAAKPVPPEGATYNEAGQLESLVIDVNKNGRPDGISYFRGALLLRTELDFDENGKVDRWDFYQADRTMEKVGFSRLNDGVMDAVSFYHADSSIDRIEISTKRDGQFDKTEYYDRNVLVRSEEDTNGDSRVDKWETWAPLPSASANEPAYAITSTSFDDTGAGKPQRRFTYGPGGVVARVDFDRDADGVFESTPDTAKNY
jgi:hypothetical protein